MALPHNGITFGTSVLVVQDAETGKNYLASNEIFRLFRQSLHRSQGNTSNIIDGKTWTINKTCQGQGMGYTWELTCPDGKKWNVFDVHIQ